MNRAPIFVSAYTPSYKKVAMRLRADFEVFHLEHEIGELRDAGSKMRNINLKPFYIASVLAKYPERPVAWIDADARIETKPELLIKGCPGADLMMLRWMNPDGLAVTVFSGTLWFANTKKSRELLGNWADFSRQFPVDPDDRNLAKAIEITPDLALEILPLEYCFVPWMHGHHYPQMKAVIRHD